MTLKSLERLMHQQMGQLQMQSTMMNTVPSYTDNRHNSGQLYPRKMSSQVYESDPLAEAFNALAPPDGHRK